MNPNSSKQAKAFEKEPIRVRNNRRPEFQPHSDLGAQAIRACSVTRYELIQLIKHWESLRLERAFAYWWCDAYCWSDFDFMARAEQRIDEFAKAVGDEVLRAAIEEATEEFGKPVDPRAWKLFLSGRRPPLGVARKWNRGQRATEEDWTTPDWEIEPD